MSIRMKLKFSYWFILYLCFISGINSLCAQNKEPQNKGAGENVRVIDSEKNQILIRQTNELQAIQVDRFGDSVRLLQLNNEMQELGTRDNKKKQALSAERDVILSRDSIKHQELLKKVDSVRSLVTGFPVELGHDTIFYVYARLGSFTPEERAHAISVKLLELAEDYFFKADSLKIIQSELTMDILYKDGVVKSVTELDAVWERSSTEELAKRYRENIISAIRKYKRENSVETRIKEISLAVLVLVVLITLIYLLAKLVRWTKNKIEGEREHKFKGVKFRNYQILDANRQIHVLLSAISILQWIIILILIYMTLPVLLGIFPWTGGLAARLISYFLDPTKQILYSVWRYLPNLLTIVVVVIFFRYFLRMLFFFKTEIESGRLKIPGFYVDWANPTFQILRALVFAFMLIVIFPYLPGSNSPIFKGVSVFLGVLFTFGSAGALGNIISGLVLTYMRAYKIGDRIQIGQVVGDVVEKSMLVTKIKTIKNEIVSIPNSTVMSSHTTNFSADALEHGLILYTSVTIGYNIPWRLIHELLIKAALKTELIEKEPPPFVFQDKLNDFYVAYQINAYTRVPNQQHITYSILHQNIQDAFNEAGVEIMSPHYSNLRDGNKTTVPEEHLPKDYVAPSFRVKDSGKDRED
jgi:small-conductance mechanosensitive channel